MTAFTSSGPAIVPILAAGRHRTPRKGACFMEFASYLAGERWSDHPECTHPALAYLARMVNDCTSDRERSRLAEFVPSVIGLHGTDPRIEIVLALRAATAALPIASEERQRAMAVGILGCRMRLEALGYSADAALDERIRHAFDLAPHSERWARDFVKSNRVATRDRAVSRMAESLIRIGVLGIAQACSPGADARLRAVLAGAIEDCRELLGREPEPAATSDLLVAAH